jgi:hypothetical protein
LAIAAMTSTAYAKPCPRDIAKKVAPAYKSADLDASRIRIRACVWGKLAGEGWLVYHVLPWPADSKAETAPFGGVAFVTADGKIAASFQGNGEEAEVDARAVDLDGDGVDKVVAVWMFTDRLGPAWGDMLQVAHVHGGEIAFAWQPISAGGVGVVCKGKLADVRAAGKKKQLVVTVKEVSRPKRDANPDAPPPEECPLGAGRHVFDYVNGQLVESK